MLVLVPFICNAVVALTVGAVNVPENTGFAMVANVASAVAVCR